MSFEKHRKKLHTLRKPTSVWLCVLMTVASVSLLSMDRANALYILTGATDAALVLDDSADSKQVEDFSSQLVYLGSKDSGYEVALRAGRTVSISADGAVVTARSGDETISALLSRLNMKPGPLDMVLVDLSGANVKLTIASDLTYYDRIEEPVSYETEYVSSVYLPQGTQKVIQQGVNGTRTAVYEVVYSGGELVSRQFVKEESNSAVKQIVAVGTGVSTVSSSDRIADVTKNDDGSGVLTFKSGGTMRFTSVKSMTGTAYTKGTPGVDSITATGTSVHVGTVAVDTRVIPLGTKMYIVTSDGSVVYGVAAAEDTGVRGNVVDLYYNSYSQCINFGRRACTVYLLDT